MAKIAKPTSSLMPALSRFLAWWGGELAALLPPAVRQWWRESDRIVLLSFDGTRARFERVAAGRREEFLSLDDGGAHPVDKYGEAMRRLQQAAGSRFRLMVCLPAEHVLSRRVTLPLAVEENLRKTLSFELDRYTPFRSEQAYFDFAVTAREPAQKRLTVDLAVAPRSAVDSGVARAAALGLTVDGAVLADEALRCGADCRNLLPAAEKRQRPNTNMRWRGAMALLPVVLLAAFLAIPIWQKRAAAIALLAPLAEAKAAAQEADGARDRLRRLVDEHNFLHDRKWASPSTLVVLHELSKLLPDDTYVMQLEMDASSVQIQGDTGSATSLVETLEASPVFKDVGFKSQLTKLQGTPYDRFHLAAVFEAAARPARPQAAAEAPAMPPATASTAPPASSPVKPEVTP